MNKYFYNFLFVFLFVFSFGFVNQANATQIITGDWARVTSQLLDGVFHSPSSFDVILDDVSPPSYNPQSERVRYNMVYSVGTKDYPDKFVARTTDNISYNFFSTGQGFNEVQTQHTANVSLVEGSQKIYIWASRAVQTGFDSTPYNRTYKYVGFINVNYFGVRDYNIKLESATSVNSSNYPLSVRVDNNPYIYTDLYYTLNTLDQNQKIKMSQVGISNKYISSPNASLRVGENKISVFVTDKSGVILPGSSAVKLFTINASQLEQRELESLVIYDGQNTLTVGGTKVRLRAKALYSNGDEEEVTGSVTWKSSNTDVLIVSNSGTLKAVSPGNAVITATLDEEYEFNQNARVTKTITVLEQAEEPVPNTDEDDEILVDDEDQVILEEGNGGNNNNVQQDAENSIFEQEVREQQEALAQRERELMEEQNRLEERLRDLENELGQQDNSNNNTAADLEKERQELTVRLVEINQDLDKVEADKEGLDSKVGNILSLDDNNSSEFFSRFVDGFIGVIIAVALMFLGMLIYRKVKHQEDK